MMTVGTAFKEHMAKYYEQHFAATQSRQPDWLQVIRERAFHFFMSQDFPTKKNEAWKYTSLARLDEIPIPTPPALYRARPQIALFNHPHPNPPPSRGRGQDRGLYFRDLPSYPLPPCGGGLGWGVKQPQNGLSIQPLSEVWNSQKIRDVLYPEGSDLFFALNTGFLDEGCFISVAPQCVVSAPVVLTFKTEGTDTIETHPRVIVDVGQNASLTVVEYHLSEGKCFSFENAVTQLYLGKNACLNYYRIQSDSAGASCRISNTVVNQKTDSRFFSFFSDSGAFVRNDLHVVLDGNGSDARVFGLYSARLKGHIDNHVYIDHVGAHTKSRTLYHGVLCDSGRAVFNGKISVKEHIKGVDASLNNHNLLLSLNAEVDTKPELEIYSDDVQCSHGATVGALDEEALFYLQTRGIPRSFAQDMLKDAFMERVLSLIPDKNVVEYVRRTRICAS